MKLNQKKLYMLVSTAALVPAIVWAASTYGPLSLAQRIERFGTYYIFMCQLLVVSRYMLAGVLVGAMKRHKNLFDENGAYSGLFIAGIAIDVWLTINMAQGVAQPPAENWSALLPLFMFAYGVPIMFAATLGSGLIVHFARRRTV
jgi:hypothetical protein